MKEARFCWRRIAFTVLICGSALFAWEMLSEGIHHKKIPIPQRESDSIEVLRFDPAFYTFHLYAMSEKGGSIRTALQWAEEFDLICAFNAGMFQTDYRSNVGYMKNGQHLNNAGVNDYQSALAFGPLKDGLPYFKMADLDIVNLQTVISQYETVVQNLRIIKAPGENRWTSQNRRWSELALGEDKSGNMLLCYSRYPLSVHDFADILLKSDIKITRAQHLEGGPEASVYLNLPNKKIQWMGSYESGFNESDNNLHYWKLPNVIGVKKR